MRWPLPRVVEGVLALVCLAGVLIVSFVFAISAFAASQSDRFEMFGILVIPERVVAALVVLLVAAVWLGFNAFRGDSTPIEGSERDSATKG